MHRLVAGQLAAASAEDRHERGEHVARAIAYGEDLARRLDFRFDAFGLDKIDQPLGAKGGQRRMEKRSLVGERLDEPGGRLGRA